MGIATALQEARTQEVHAAGFAWKIRPISSADLTEATTASLLMLPIKGQAGGATNALIEMDAKAREVAAAEIAANAAIEADDEAAVEAALEVGYAAAARLQELLKYADRGAIRVGKERQADVVCAGVTHVYDPAEKKWARLAVVKGERESKDVPGGLSILNILYLPPGAEAELCEAILALTNDGGWADRARRFHGGAGAAAADRPNSGEA